MNGEYPTVDRDAPRRRRNHLLFVSLLLVPQFIACGGSGGDTPSEDDDDSSHLSGGTTSDDNDSIGGANDDAVGGAANGASANAGGTGSTGEGGGGGSSNGAAPGIGGEGSNTGGLSSSSGGTAGEGNSSCEEGAPDTDWPDDCSSASSDPCVDGDWAIFDPTGADQMPAVREQSAHFALRWEGDLVSATQAQSTMTLFEDIWDQIVGRIGFAEPFCDSSEKFKVNVHIRTEGGFTGSGVQGVPAMWVEVGGIDNRGLLAHEFTHGLQFSSRGMRDSPYVGWAWESQADWMNHQLTQHRENLDCAGRAPSLANFPHLYYGSTRNRYCNWQFWEFLKDKHCYQAVVDIWLKSPEVDDPARTTEDPFSVLARNMAWSVGELNDFFGQWALHNVTWDYRDPDGTDQGAVYRQAWGHSDADLNAGSPPGNRSLRVTQLEALEGEERRYHVPSMWAPQRWGYNLVRLHPNEQEDGTVTVSFRGVLQDAPANESFSPYADTPENPPAPDSDWRWGVVAVDASGAPRYSSLQQGSDGELCFERKSTDLELWLVVMATPSVIHKIMWDQKYFSIYRYPWMVELEGAVPDGFQADAMAPSEAGDLHENGGGWVSSAASVADSAYVGPYASVLGGTVTGGARIEDHAIIIDGSVSENAVVGGLTILGGGLSVSGDAVLKSTFQSPGTFEGGQSISGTAQVLGDVELRGQNASLTEGVFYGYIEAGHASAEQHGAQQTTPMVEVTTAEPFVWRP